MVAPQPWRVASLRMTMPATISPTASSRNGLGLSPKSRMPRAKAPTAPMPTQMV